jgi:hypothetical protein
MGSDATRRDEPAASESSDWTVLVSPLGNAVWSHLWFDIDPLADCLLHNLVRHGSENVIGFFPVFDFLHKLGQL